MGGGKENPSSRTSRKRAPRPDLYTAQEAVDHLHLPKSTFRYYVKRGLIPRYVPPLKTEGFYPVAFIDTLADFLTGETPVSEHHLRALTAQARTLLEARDTSIPPHRGATDWITRADLPFVQSLDLDVYGPDDTVDMSVTWRWWEKNPTMCRILFNAHDRRDVWGALTVMPMSEETIFRLLRREMEEREITPDHIFTYEPGHSYSGYVASVTVRPQYRPYLRSLVRSVLDFWCGVYPSIQLTRLYGFALGNEGLRLIRHLFFSPRYDMGVDAFELDLMRPGNPSRLVGDFQHCLRQKEEGSER